MARARFRPTAPILKSPRPTRWSAQAATRTGMGPGAFRLCLGDLQGPIRPGGTGARFAENCMTRDRSAREIGPAEAKDSASQRAQAACGCGSCGCWCARPCGTCGNQRPGADKLDILDWFSISIEGLCTGLHLDGPRKEIDNFAWPARGAQARNQAGSMRTIRRLEATDRQARRSWAKTQSTGAGHEYVRRSMNWWVAKFDYAFHQPGREGTGSYSGPENRSEADAI